MKKTLSLCYLFLAIHTQLLAQFGALVPDSTFNFTSTVSRDSFCTKKLIEIDDGRILCAGYVL